MNIALWIAEQLASLPSQTWILFALALAISASGFYRVVYFVSIGYAFSIVAMAVAGLLIWRSNLTWYSLIHSVVLAAYGLRLGLYLLRRERQASYRRELASVQARGSGIDALGKVLIWVGVSLLYVAMFSPNLFALASPPPNGSWLFLLVQIGGLTIMIMGLALETTADRQKSAFKARHPDQFCDMGVYRWIRCPNYFGEIVFWTGNWVMGLWFYDSLLRWVVSLAGLICITLIMMGSTKRLERAQDERYGATSKYQRYVRTVPVLFPFVPVYTLKNVRVYLE